MPDPAPARAPRTGSPVCTATTKAGTLCSAPAMIEGERCVAHSPKYSDEQRKVWRQRGRIAQRRAARAPFDPADFSTAKGARRALEHAADAVRAERMTVSVANAVAKLAGAAIRASEAEVSRRLADLEKRLSER